MLLVFTAGILVTVTIEEIVPEAHKGKNARVATMCLAGGFNLFSLLSVHLD